MWTFGMSVFGRVVMSGIEETGKKVASKAKKVAADTVESVKDVAGGAVEAAGDAADAGIDAAKGALGAVGGMLGGIASKASAVAGDAVDAAKSAADSVGDKIGDLADGAVDAAKGAVDGVSDAVGGMAGKAGDLASGAADMVGDAANKVGGAGVAAVGAGAAVLGGAAAGLGNMGKGALSGVTGGLGLTGGTSGGGDDGTPPMAARLDAAEARNGGGGGFLLPLAGVLGLGFLAYFGWQTIVKGDGTMFKAREPAPVAAPAAPVVASLPAWLTSIGDKLKASFAWLTLGINGNNVIVSGEADTEEAKTNALKEVTAAVKAAPEGATSLIIDNIKVKGSTSTPVGAALATLGSNPTAAACNTAFGTTMAGRTINFSTGGASIGADNASLLDTLTAVANACKAHKIEVAGHTDSVGKPENNQALSQKRADAVKAYWTGKGVAAEGLVAKGYGETKPVEPVADETANEKNRRIEFTVTDAAAAPAPAPEPAK
jgi:outer membrane protein OmpA-like peptidoglycan-associated protein